MSELDRGQNSASCQTELFELSDSLKENLWLLGSSYLFGSSDDKEWNCSACGWCPCQQWHLLTLAARLSAACLCGDSARRALAALSAGSRGGHGTVLAPGWYQSRGGVCWAVLPSAELKPDGASEPLFLNELWSSVFLLCFKIADTEKLLQKCLSNKRKWQFDGLFVTVNMLLPVP